jgi:hypothetical protein
MAQRKASRQSSTPRPKRGSDDEITAKALKSMLLKFGATIPEATAPQLIKKDPVILKRLAKYLVQQCFRNTVIEDYHAGYGPGPGKSNASRITQAEMKALMIEAVEKTYSFLWVLFQEDIGLSLLADFGAADPIEYWSMPKLDPKFAVGLVGMMRVFAVGSQPAEAKPPRTKL